MLWKIWPNEDNRIIQSSALFQHHSLVPAQIRIFWCKFNEELEEEMWINVEKIEGQLRAEQQ